MRWGIVGTGAIAAHFAEALTRVPGASCVAVSSRRAETGQAFATGFGIDRVVEGAAALGALDSVQAVYVATPNHCHETDALAVIAAGKPVLCEKPLATDAVAAQRIVEAARTAGVFCMEGMWSLTTPVYRDAFARVLAGEIGELCEIQGSFAVPQSPEAMPRLHDPALGGGALLDRGVYLLALSQALLGDLELRHVSGDLGPGGVDLAATLIVENAIGARAVLSCAIDRAGDNRLILSGKTGYCAFNEPVTCPTAYRLTRRDPSSSFTGPSGTPGIVARLKTGLKQSPQLRRLHRALRGGERSFSGGLKHQIIEVEACLAKGLTESPLVPLNGSLKVLALIDEARQRLSLAIPTH